ncbi:uroporphyrinogen decarboxylase family protein [Aerococcus sp. UMB1112A]|uniref:uroporphyrinogen decarboxylase family protein n=1 Tax=Aerococcus sp. UMB1112A TaxID=3050609 RepID=UPI00254EA553|nr:uroporphyrinogen decarboxylase family protein [Aerococcus sp. UMB1112A]MDK8502578.1 uroporphyrinogen decarboxylase family protein [Aerococcus sp. UMB1112A]
MDQMTAVERYQALKNGQSVDRAPVILYDNLIAAKLVGMTYQESESSAEALAKKLVASYQTFGHDAVSLIYSTKNFTKLLGTEVKVAEDAPASVSRYALDDLADLDCLPYDAVHFDNDLGQQKVFQAVKIIQEETDGQVYCRIHMPAPFTAAAGLIAPEKLLRATRKQKDELNALLNRVLAILKDVVDQFSQLEGTYISLSDPVASGSLISPRVYRQFAQGYTQELVNYIHQKESFVALHICGQTEKILADVVETGVDAFSVDQVVDLAKAKEILADHLQVQGNIAPVDLLWQGDPQSISQAVEAAYACMGTDPMRFVLAPGCDVPAESPLENIHAYMDAARRFGQVTSK